MSVQCTICRNKTTTRGKVISSCFLSDCRAHIRCMMNTFRCPQCRRQYELQINRKQPCLQICVKEWDVTQCAIRIKMFTCILLAIFSLFALLSIIVGSKAHSTFMPNFIIDPLILTWSVLFVFGFYHQTPRFILLCDRMNDCFRYMSRYARPVLVLFRISCSLVLCDYVYHWYYSEGTIPLGDVARYAFLFWTSSFSDRQLRAHLWNLLCQYMFECPNTHIFIQDLFSHIRHWTPLMNIKPNYTPFRGRIIDPFP